MERHHDTRALPMGRSKTQLLLRETWRKAWQRAQAGDTLQIVFRTESQAHKARMDLYKAVQAEKQGRSEDLELTQAAQGLEIVLHPEQRNILIMRDRGQGDIYTALQEATGLNLHTVIDADLEARTQESLKELERMGLEPEKRKTGAEEEATNKFGIGGKGWRGE